MSTEYLRLRNTKVHSREVVEEGEVNVDRDENSRVVGVEVHGKAVWHRLHLEPLTIDNANIVARCRRCEEVVGVCSIGGGDGKWILDSLKGWIEDCRFVGIETGPTTTGCCNCGPVPD